MSKSQDTTKAVNAPPENKQVKNAPETKSEPTASPPSKKESAPQTFARAVRQPMMGPAGVVAKHQVFPCGERDLKRYGRLAEPATADDFAESQAAIKAGKFALYASSRDKAAKKQK